jgi:hypothetical protein
VLGLIDSDVLVASKVDIDTFLGVLERRDIKIFKAKQVVFAIFKYIKRRLMSICLPFVLSLRFDLKLLVAVVLKFLLRFV